MHAAHGIGQVKGTDIKDLRGGKKTYYKIKTQDLIYWLSIENSSSNRVRGVCAPSTFSKALSMIKAKPTKLNNNFRIRVNQIKDELAKGSLTGNARLIRDLNARHALKELHINELRILDKLKNNFISEYSVACGLEPEVAGNRLENALAEGVQKLLAK